MRQTAQPAILKLSNSDDARALALARSCSSPALLLGTNVTRTEPMRSRSESDLMEASIILDRLRCLAESRIQATAGVPLGRGKEDTTSSPDNAQTFTLHVREQTRTDCSEHVVPFPDYEEPDPSISDGVPHLHKMDISQQLRSMSQMSEATEFGSLTYAMKPRALLNRSRSELHLSSGRGRHARQKSSSGIDSASVPACWGRVCSPVRDAASSIYSRPVSPVSSISDHNDQRERMSQEERLVNLNSIFADWPLKSSEPTPERQASRDHPHEMVDALGSNAKVSASGPVDGNEEFESSSSFTTATDNGDAASVRLLALPRKPTPIPSKSSSSVLTQASKKSRFLERFSPPTKLVRKRLSVFKFLRPGSRKQQVRSVSSPILNTASTGPTTQLDGESDDPALLTIQYELGERPNHVTRSVSMDQLGTSTGDAGGLLTPSAPLERRPTLADYERHLSVVGDDRRKPSSVNIQKVKDIEEHDRRESVSVRRKLSRARELRDDSSPLMTQALEKHQQEKALFRSASKQRDSLKDSQAAPSFSSTPFLDTSSSLSAPLTADYSDLLDPLEKGHLIGAKRRTDTGQFLTPAVHGPGPSQRSSRTASAHVLSTKTRTVASTVQRPSKAGKRIGTSLGSWSRYPSHTRLERAGPAGLSDAVISRDFAVDINLDEIHVDEQTESDLPIKRHLGDSSSPRSRSAAPSSRSVTFSGILRYYSNLFTTRGWHGQNRRTSVTLGGRLEYPELEMLPPQRSAEATSSHKHSEHLKRFEEHIKEDAEKFKHYLKEEESKVQNYIKGEEDKLGDFVKEEEHKFEDFVKKEESKLKDFVQEGEEKWVHSSDGRRPESSRQSSHSSNRKESPFRTGSIFEAPPHQTTNDMKRSETMIGPNDGIYENEVDGKMPDSRLALDGSDEAKGGVPSQAEVWSELYKECLLHPISSGTSEVDDPARKVQNQLMPPPKLKPVKPRTPDKPNTLDPEASIRRFPSVTVIDDQKGHSRSISLVSVQTRKSTIFERCSTHEMVELIQTREHEERERLLNAVKLTE